MKSLFDLPHAEAARLCRSGAPVFLGVNPVEYHGPHLSLHNDRLIALGLARDIAAHLAPLAPRGDWPFLYAGDLEVGVEPAPGPGSRPTPYREARALVVEACRALVELGARRVVLMTFHGAPLHSLALEAGVQACLSAGVAALAPLNLLLHEMIVLADPSPYRQAVAHLSPAEQEETLGLLRTDFHAGFFETSMTLHYAPESVAPLYRTLPPCPPPTPDATLAMAAQVAKAVGREALARELELASVGRGWGAMRPFYGYTAHPARATSASGAFFAKIIVDLFATAAEAVLLHQATPPAPVMRWVEPLSLGGRLPAAHVAAHDLIALPPSA